jgi:hypothetical protein
MPIPTPHSGENQQAFVSRCIGAVSGEFPAEGQAAAVCYQAWRDRKSSMKEQLLESIRKRSGRSGVLTADRYFRSIESCFEGGFCPTKLFKSASQEQWAKALKESEGHLTYSSNRMKFDVKSIKAASDVPAIEDAIRDDQIRAKALAIVDGVLTTTKRDRDGDILETKGAHVDPMLPLLWQHISVAPIGKMLRILKHTDKILIAQFAIANTELGEDTLKLIEIGALRISHGFDPIDYELLEDEKGWHFKEWEMFEASGVSVPSNTEAVWTAYSRNALKSDAVRGWAKNSFDARTKQGIGFDLPPLNKGDRITADWLNKLRDAALASSEIKKALSDEPPCSCKSKTPEPEVKAMDEMCKCPECGHKGPMSEFMDDGMKEMPRSFDVLRKKLVMEAFSQPPEEIRKIVLSLQGVADLADARTEEAAWQSAFEEMGLE